MSKNLSKSADSSSEGGTKYISPAQQAVLAGFENIGRSMAQVGDFLIENPSEFQKVMPVATEIDQQFFSLAARAREIREYREGLKRLVDETTETGWVAGKLHSGENCPCVPVSNAFGRVVNSFGDL